MKVVAIGAGVCLLAFVFVVLSAIGARDSGWRIVGEAWLVTLGIVAVISAGAALVTWGLS